MNFLERFFGVSEFRSFGVSEFRSFGVSEKLIVRSYCSCTVAVSASFFVVFVAVVDDDGVASDGRPKSFNSAPLELKSIST
jgi:hypothetical protein